MAALGSGAEVADLGDVASGKVGGYVLLNTTSVGMHPDVDSTPVPQAALGAYRLVFDAVYTPVDTRLLQVGHSILSASRLWSSVTSAWMCHALKGRLKVDGLPVGSEG